MKIFFLGISGTFMGNLAQMACHLGHEVSGCDDKVYPPMSHALLEAGIVFSEGYVEENYQPADLYIIGNTISKNNHLLQKILTENNEIISGPDWLYHNVLKEKEVIAVSGTHGKTTVTSMISHILEKAGYAPGYLIAGVPLNSQKSWSISKSNYFVIEADEYDTAYFDKGPKFFHYRPNILLINNIEFDHADIYENLEMIENNFISLLEKMSNKDVAHINEYKVSARFKDLILKSQKIKANIKFFKSQAQNINAENLGATVSVLKQIIPDDDVNKFLGSYKGVKRRYQTLYEDDNFKLIDDFAHHPTAIAETQKIAKNESSNIVQIIELGSNSMRSGIHDQKLKSIFASCETYTINASTEQKERFRDVAKELQQEDISKILSIHADRKLILMCGNKNFQGFQKLILDMLTKSL